MAYPCEMDQVGIEALLAEPIIRLVMEADKLREADVRAVLLAAAKRLVALNERPEADSTPR